MQAVQQPESAQAGTIGSGRPELRPGPVCIRNAFNRETFIFPVWLDDLDPICTDVILEKGGSGGGDGLEHIHPLADEVFSVRSGYLRVFVRGRMQLVGAGETVTIPRGAPHHFSNANHGDTMFSVSFIPPQQHRRLFANFALTTHKHARWFSKRGKPSLLLMALVLHHYADHLYLASMPVFLQKLLFAMLAPVARLRGYRLEIEPEDFR